MKKLFALARGHAFKFDENSLYPTHEPQVTEDQISERRVKALLEDR